jgi:hypothetical protein
MSPKLGLLGAAVAVLAWAAPFVPAGASAAASSIPSGFQITVSESAPSMVYGGPSPSFRASVTESPDDVIPVNTFPVFYLLVDSQTIGGDVSGSAPTYSLSVSGLAGIAPLSGGQHSVVAQYVSHKHGLVTSAPVTLTVLKGTPILNCAGGSVPPTSSPNAPFMVSTSFGGINAPVDWQNGTFAVIFTGAQTFTMGGLAANSAGQVMATTPSVPGVYQVKCSFSGTGSVNPVEARLGTPTIIVTANHATGGIQLRTDPTPVTGGQQTTWNVVVLGGSGLPAPTGTVSIRIGSYFTSAIALSGGGSVTFQTYPASGSFAGSSIRVWYSGDPVYAAAGADFSLSTPPISGSAGSPVAGHPGSPIAAVAGPSQTAAPDPATVPGSPAAMAAPGGQTAETRPAAGPSSVRPATSSLVLSPARLVAYGGGVRSLIGVVVLVTLIGLGLGVAWRRRRRNPAAAP